MRWPWQRDELDARVRLLEAVQDTLRDTVGHPPPGATVPDLTDDVSALTGQVLDNARAITDLRADVSLLRTAVAEGIAHEERREKRIQATVRRARKELASHGFEDPGLEAEFEGLAIVEDEQTDPDQVDWNEEPDDVVDVDESAQVPGMQGITYGDLKRLRGG